jgi:TonB family protein
LTSSAYRDWPASARRLTLALAASACGHAALLANAGFTSEAATLSLFAAGAPIRVRIAAQPSAAPEVPHAEPAPAVRTPAAGLPAEIFYRASDLDQRAEPLNEALIEYPEGAVVTRLVGKVTLRLRIDRQGELRDASVVEAEPSGVFEAAALKAVHSLKFKPAIRNGTAVGSIKLIEVPFDPLCARAGNCVNGPEGEPAPR